MSMMVSDSNVVSTTASTGITSNVTGNASFQEVQATESVTSTPNPNTDWVASDPNAPVSGDGWTWTAVAPGVETGTMPDGTAVGYCNLDLALTPEDKKLVGWPCDDDPEMLAIAGMIGGDRACGDLTGPITADYVFGYNSCGLVERIPDLSDDTVDALARNLLM